MKHILITILLISTGNLSMAQNSGRTPGEPGNDPVIIRDTRGSTSVSEAIAILTTIRAEINSRTGNSTTSKPSGLTESHYQTLITNADDFMIRRKYDDAILLYNEVLKNKDDQYAKDRILEAQALRAKQQKQEEQQKKDETLRAEAEAASADTHSKHAVHFTGALMSDVSSDKAWTTEAFNRNDPYSDFLQPGRYNNLSADMKKAADFTLDGIAIPANTRLIVYEKPNCAGAILLDVTGPAIVNNGYRVSNRRFKALNTKQFKEELQACFPQPNRAWSETNMHDWTNGSIEIQVVVAE